jgi:hypothetical protein
MYQQKQYHMHAYISRHFIYGVISAAAALALLRRGVSAAYRVAARIMSRYQRRNQKHHEKHISNHRAPFFFWCSGIYQHPDLRKGVW